METLPQMKPKDWLACLKVHICHVGKLPDDAVISNSMLAAWINENIQLSRPVLPRDLSVLRSTHGQKSKFHIEMIAQIKSFLPMSPIVKHLTRLRLRSSPFYSQESQPEISGSYLARRLSFSNPGRVNVSAFKFGKSASGRPFFKEKRVIEKPGIKYQIRTRGVYFHDRRGLSLHGMSYELKPGLKERNSKLKDLMNEGDNPFYDDHYYMNKDADNSQLIGVVPFIIKRSAEVSVTKMILNRIENPSSLEWWDEVETSGEIGIRDLKEKEADELYLQEWDNDFAMPVIKHK